MRTSRSSVRRDDVPRPHSLVPYAAYSVVGTSLSSPPQTPAPATCLWPTPVWTPTARRRVRPKPAARPKRSVDQRGRVLPCSLVSPPAAPNASDPPQFFITTARAAAAGMGGNRGEEGGNERIGTAQQNNQQAPSVAAPLRLTRLHSALPFRARRSRRLGWMGSTARTARGAFAPSFRAPLADSPFCLLCPPPPPSPSGVRPRAGGPGRCHGH